MCVCVCVFFLVILSAYSDVTTHMDTSLIASMLLLKSLMNSVQLMNTLQVHRAKSVPKMFRDGKLEQLPNGLQESDERKRIEKLEMMSRHLLWDLGNNGQGQDIFDIF